MNTTLKEKAVVGRRILHDHASRGPDRPGIITRLNPGEAGGFFVRLDGDRRPFFIPPKFYDRVTFLDEVVDVPALPMGPFTPVADVMNGFYEHDGLVVTAVGEDGEDLVVLTDDKETAYAAAIGYGPTLGFDPDYFDRDDMQTRWVVFEWQPEDAKCSWFMNPAAEGDDQAVHVFYLPTA